jgi:amino acid permease
MNTLILATCSCIVYALIHYIDKKIIKKEEHCPRTTFRTSALMFVSIMAGSFLYDQLDLENLSNSVSEKTTLTGGAPKVFTDNPGF